MRPSALLLLALVLPRPPASADWDPRVPVEPVSRPAATGSPTSPTVLFGLAAIRGYQVLLSPLLGGRCQFEPSCSRYTMACVRDHGLIAGTWRGADRISRCHGFTELGGYAHRTDFRFDDAPGH